MTLHEELEQLEQDAARFRWMCQNLRAAEGLLYVAADGDIADWAAYIRAAVDAQRLPPPNALLDAPGGRYDGE